MPAKHSIKQYQENGYYHLYNRGVEKRLIFVDKQDYSVFLSYLKEYLLPKEEKTLRERLGKPKTPWSEKNKILKALQLNNFSEELSFLAYSLMPNHFHFLIKQKSKNTIDRFLRSLGTRYTMYFNRKNKRVGPLYQGSYKAVLIETDGQLLYLTKYIHRQALIPQGDSLENQEAQPTSYADYLGLRKTAWVKPEEILSFFSKTNPALSYENFVKGEENPGNIEKFTLEEN